MTHLAYRFRTNAQAWRHCREVVKLAQRARRRLVWQRYGQPRKGNARVRKANR